MSEKITSSVVVQVLIAESSLWLLEWECHGTGRLLGQSDQTLPDEWAVQINGNDIGTQSQQDVKRSHGRSSSQQDKVTVGKFAPLWVVDASNDSFSSSWFDGSVVDPLFDLCLQGVSLENLSLVRNFQTTSLCGTFSLDQTSFEFFSILGSHGLLETDSRSIGCDKFKDFVGLVQTSLGNLQSIFGRFALFLDESNQVLGVSETVSLGLANGLGLFRIDGTNGRSKDLLVDWSGTTGSLLRVVNGEANSTWWWWWPGESLLEGRLAVSNHVHNHTRGSDKVNGGQKPSVHKSNGSTQESSDRLIGSSLEKDSQFSSDPGGVQDGKQGVSGPEQKVGSLFGRISSDDSKGIEHVTENFHQSPGNDHDTSTPLVLGILRFIDSPQGGDSGSNLKSGNNNRRSDQTDSSMKNLQKSSTLRVGQESSKTFGGIDAGQRLPQATFPRDDGGNCHHENDRPSCTAEGVVKDQIHILGTHLLLIVEVANTQHTKD
mmetsp:Transcript_18451/g.45745  ORF Transcript_18451/g.45745 Transcript_18451/m.45745 type:complete len:488 (-) Transcript_18451:44-1507(-)